MEVSRLTRDGTAEPVSRDQILRRERGQGNIHFPVQLTTSRIGNLTWLIHTLAIYYNHTYSSIFHVIGVLGVCVVIPFILNVRFVDVPAGVTRFLPLPYAVLAFIFLARRIQPFLSVVDREVEFCAPTV